MKTINERGKEVDIFKQVAEPGQDADCLSDLAELPEYKQRLDEF
jgi:hypothetical protein